MFGPRQVIREPSDGALDSAAGERPDRPAQRPQHQGRAAIAARELYTFVAGYRYVLVVRFHPVQHPGRQQFPRQQRQLAVIGLRAVGRDPSEERSRGIEHLVVHFFPILVIGFVPVIGVPEVIHGAGLVDVEDGGVQRVIRPPGRPYQDPTHRGVGILQHGERQALLAVVMLQKPDQLVAGSGRCLPVLELDGDPLLLRAEVRRVPPRRSRGPLQDQVVDEDDTVAGGYRPGLVDAIRVERCEGELGGLFGVQSDDGLPFLVADDQFTSGACHRQRQHQRGHHSVDLLGISVWGEEPARLIHQQLVRVRGRALGRAAESRCGPCDDLRQGVVPRAAGHLHLRRIDLPAGANRAVHERQLAAAVGRPLRGVDQRSRLLLGDGKGKRARTFDVHPRHRHEQSALRTVVARAVDRPQEHFERRLLLVVDNVHVPHRQPLPRFRVAGTPQGDHGGPRVSPCYNLWRSSMPCVPEHAAIGGAATSSPVTA